jgi:hypothetical protein
MDLNDLNMHIIPLVKDEETVRLTILTNICKMMVRRGNMSIEQYSLPDKLGHFDDKLFLDLFKDRTDSNIYEIPMNVHLLNEKKNKQTEFDGSKLIVRIIPQSIADISNNTMFLDFMKTYSAYHRILVFYEVADKVFNSAEKKPNLEIFDRNSLMIDLMAYSCSPIECRIIQPDEIGHMINPKHAKILQNDPLAKYYNAKKGNIIRIVRRSINNGREVGYRKVIDSKPVFK